MSGVARKQTSRSRDGKCQHCKDVVTDITKHAARATSILSRAEDNAPHKRWEDADVVRGTRKWIAEVVLGHSICPFASVDAANIVVSQLTEAHPDLVVGIDVKLLQKEARALLSSKERRATVLIVHPHIAELDNFNVEKRMSDAKFHKRMLEEWQDLDQNRKIELQEVADNKFEQRMEDYMEMDAAIKELFTEILPLGITGAYFYPAFWLDLDYRSMPWFSVQLFREEELWESRPDWHEVQGTSSEDYDIKETVLEEVRDAGFEINPDAELFDEEEEDFDDFEDGEEDEYYEEPQVMSPRAEARRKVFIEEAANLTQLFFDIRHGLMPSAAPDQQAWLQVVEHVA